MCAGCTRDAGRPAARKARLAIVELVLEEAGYRRRAGPTITSVAAALDPRDWDGIQTLTLTSYRRTPDRRKPLWRATRTRPPATAAQFRFETHFDADVVVPQLYDFLQEVGAGRAS